LPVRISVSNHRPTSGDDPPVFVVNGLKREELVASNSMILHELFFASLGAESEPEGELRDALARDFGSVDRWRAEFSAIGARRRVGIIGVARIATSPGVTRSSTGRNVRLLSLCIV
jgi:hypothetical protein